MNGGSNSIASVDANDYVEANLGVPDLKNAKDANMSSYKQLEATEDENGYLRPLSKSGNFTLVKEVTYSNINTVNEHHYMNSKYEKMIIAIMELKKELQKAKSKRLL